VFILNAVKVVCFDALLEVFILKVLSRAALVRVNWERGVSLEDAI
jgi:hypothetical protein